MAGHLVDFSSLEMLEDMAVINKIDSAITKERKVINRRDVIDMRIVDCIDVDESRNMTLSAAKV